MMASSSFSSVEIVNPQVKYDVFLSFKGEDTRNNFISHLYAALCRNKIETFIDNQLIRGEEISPSLLDAIERSTISVVIFSERYASSRWCLEELVKILECKSKYGQIVIPVFYHVDPSNVRNQNRVFGDAFSELEDRFQGRLDMLQRWRLALREAANISGIDSNVIRTEYELIEEVVKEILKRLDSVFSSDSNDGLVGAEPSIRIIESSLLSTGLKDVYCLGIWGIGGIGKTTIANAILSKISRRFDGSYFIKNIREESEKSGGLAHLRQKFLSAILEDGNVSSGSFDGAINFESRRLNRKKVLIVFDDVSSPEQIELLIGRPECFKPGSRVIITTRDKQVLKSWRVDEIHEVKQLTEDDALKLFSRYAFEKNHPDVSYLELSKKILTYAKGVPLALKVLGRFLCGRRKEDWESAMHKLKRIPHVDIMKVLKVSYDGLDDEEQSIFLDIACFFKGEDKDFVIKFLDANGFSAEIEISVLVDKCLLYIRKNRIMMHDLLQKMGREIIRQESIKDPEKRSRLYHHGDIYNVLMKNTGTEAIEGISLDMSKVKEIHLNTRAFSKMHKLRFLKFYSSCYSEDMNKVHNFQNLESLLTELRYLEWHGCPLKTLTSNIRSENLFALEMPHSSIRQLWKGVQRLLNLKYVNLSFSKHLTKIPDLSLATNLESLNFKGCTSLVETHSSIRYLNKLVVLNLQQCRSLESPYTSVHMGSLKKLLLSGCSNLKSFPELSCNIEELSLDGTAIKELPSSSIEHLSSLIILSLRNCSRLEALPTKISRLKSLKRLYLSGCTNLKRLPYELGNLEALELLDVQGIPLREVPSSSKNLDILSFGRFNKGHELFGLTSLTCLRLTDCGITELPESLGHLSSLKCLELGKNDFERIPESIILLSKLFSLDLSYCEKLQSLPELPCNLGDFKAHRCSSLVALSGFAVFFKKTFWKSKIFDFTNCSELDQNEVKEIIEGAKMKMQLQAIAWWKKLNWDKIPFISIVFPGGEIPEWFMFKSKGSSINLKLPPGWFNDKKFVGFVTSSAVGFRNHQNNNNNEDGVVCESRCQHEDGYLVVFRELGVYNGCCTTGPHFGGGSDQIFMRYNHVLSCSVKYNNVSGDVIFRFYVEYPTDGKRVECCEVTKCGVHLLYAKDFANSKEEEESGWSFSSVGEEEEPLPPQPPPLPPRKRLKNCVGPSLEGGFPFVKGAF